MGLRPRCPLQAGLNVGGSYHGKTRLRLSGGQRHRMVSLKIKREYFHRLIEDYALHLLPSACQKLLPSESVGLSFRKPLSPGLECLAHQILGCPYEGSARRLFMEAKALEILACQIGELHGRIPRESTVRGTGDLERLYHAREILDTEYADPPTLVVLARRVGLNDFKLKRGFRELLGTTVFGYVRKLRMEKARQLLETTDMSVTQVALSVGYNSFSHFTKAFKGSMGVLPSQYRRAERPGYVNTSPESVRQHPNPGFLCYSA